MLCAGSFPNTREKGLLPEKSDMRLSWFASIYWFDSVLLLFTSIYWFDIVLLVFTGIVKKQMRRDAKEKQAPLRRILLMKEHRKRRF